MTAEQSRWADAPGRYRIHWTSNAEAEACLALINSGEVRTHPDLAEALESRVGRNGRCRLWMSGGIAIDPGITSEAFESPPLVALACYLIDISAGGVVFHQALADQARRLPGIVTTMSLELA